MVHARTGPRLSSISSHLASYPSTGDTMSFQDLPDFDDLPKFKDFSGCAWSVWGPNDQLGTINLLSPELVQVAAKEEIKTGRSVCLNWPINFPTKPLFGRRAPHITHISRKEDHPTRDDEIHINTQSGSQWDGLRHFGLLDHGIIYNNTPAEEIKLGTYDIKDPLHVNPELIKLGIHNWAQHGISGRGVLLDLVRFHSGLTNSISALPYNPWATHPFPASELQACADKQGVTFRKGDILFIRGGFIKKYNEATQEDRDRLAEIPETFAGLEQSEDMKRFLWNNHFAAVASDQPALERWPPLDGRYLHETLLGLWGMPIGELFDLEQLSAVCNETGRYTFFLSSWPLNILGGSASPPNAAAYF